MINKYSIEFTCDKKNKNEIIDEIDDIFQTIPGLSLIFENKIIKELENHSFDGSTISYHNNKEGISFYFFTDLCSGEVKIDLNPRKD